jgi:hypothetical protein
VPSLGYISFVLLSTAALLASSSGYTQATPAAEAAGLRFHLGAGVSVADTDYATHAMYGVTAFGGLVYRARYGLQAEGHTIQFNRYGNLREDTILGGPRLIYVRNRYRT